RHSRRVLRREPRRHRADGLLLSWTQRQRRRSSATARVRSALARESVRPAAEARSGASGWPVCGALAPWTAWPPQPNRHCARLERRHGELATAALHPSATPVLAQQFVDQEEPLVRAGAATRAARRSPARLELRPLMARSNWDEGGR